MKQLTTDTLNAICINPPKAKPGDKVSVHNYNRRRKDGLKIWEKGVVKYVKAGLQVNENGFISVNWSYDVLLDRKRTGRNEGYALWIHAGQSEIETNII
jgi:hypothetical protein